MTFSEATIRDAEEKYQQLVSGSLPCPISKPEMDSFSLFEQKSKKFHERLAEEDAAIKKAQQTIRANRDKRLEVEAAEKKRIEAEKAAEKKKAEEAEKARREEIARQEWEARLRQMEEEELRKKIIITVLIAVGAIALIVGLIFGIRALVINGEKQEYAKYSADNIIISIEDKVEATKTSSYYDGYITAFKMKITNKSLLSVIQIKGEMKIYNASSELLITTNCTFSGDLQTDEVGEFTLNIDNRQSDEVVEFYYADYEDLMVTFRISEIIYEGYESREYNEDPVTILALSVGSDGVSKTEMKYQNALSLYNQGRYEEALTLFGELGYYKDSTTYYSDCYEKAENARNERAYQTALSLLSNEKYGEAINAFIELYNIGYKDSRDKIKEAVALGLSKAEALAAVGDYQGAFNIVNQLDNDYYWSGISSARNMYSYAKNGDFGTAVYYGLKTVILPEGLEQIESGCFSETSVEKVVLPRSLKYIGASAFEDCRSLKSINLPNGLLTVENNAFYGCSSLTITSLPASLTKIGDNAFRGCTELRGDIVIGNSVLSIGSYAFAACDNIISVVIGNSVVSIADSAFSSCDNLVSVTIPASVTGIGSNAFSDCKKLVELINKSSLSFELGSSQNGGAAKYALEIHSGSSKISKVNGYIFYTAGGINYLIGYEGEETNLVLPTRYNGSNYTIHNYAFNQMNKITGVVISDYVTGIGEQAFYSCDKIESVVIGNAVTSVGYAAFEDCIKLGSVTIGNSVISLGNEAFRNCESLTNVIIPSSVKTIGQYAFYDCSSLQTVTFQNTANWYTSSTSSTSGGRAVTNLSNTFDAASSLSGYYSTYYWFVKE